MNRPFALAGITTSLAHGRALKLHRDRSRSRSEKADSSTGEKPAQLRPIDAAVDSDSSSEALPTFKELADVGKALSCDAQS